MFIYTGLTLVLVVSLVRGLMKRAQWKRDYAEKLEFINRRSHWESDDAV